MTSPQSQAGEDQAKSLERTLTLGPCPAHRVTLPPFLGEKTSCKVKQVPFTGVCGPTWQHSRLPSEPVRPVLTGPDTGRRPV